MSMNKTQVLLALLLSAGLVACGDDATEDTTTDTTPDTTDAGDTTPEPDTDTTPEPDADTTPEPDGETTPEPDGETTPPAELCGDEIDNDGDGDIDCDDSDCDGDFACEVPIDDCDCDETTEVCIGGTCEPLTAIDEYVPAENWSYVSRLYLPGQDDDECCFDFNNDGLIDNGLATNLLPLVGGLLGGDIQDTIDEAFEGGDINLLLEWRQHPEAGTGPVKLSFWLGESDSTYADLAAGNGTVQVNDDSYGEAGSFIQFNTAEMDGYALTAGPSLFRLQIPLGDLLEGLELLDLTIQAARIEAELDSADFRATVNDGDIGGGKLGGVLPLDQIFGTINDLVKDCTCADGIDGTTDVINYGDGDGIAYSATCSRNSFNVSACDTEVCSEYLNLICGTALPALSAIPLADIDTNGNGVEDAISIGGYLTMVGAEIADPWFASDEVEGSGEEGSGAL